MLDAILVVLSRARDGRHDAFNDWYTNIHLRDVLRFRGAVAAQRFGLSKTQPGPVPDGFRPEYLALYEVDNAALFCREHLDNVMTPRMRISTAFDDSYLNDFHYYPLQFRDNDPQARKGSVLLEQLNPAAGADLAFRAWYSDHYLPTVLKRPGVQSGAFLMFRRDGQLMPFEPSHAYVGLYRLEDAAAARAWENDHGLGDPTLMDRAGLTITCWEPLIPRMTRDDVVHTNAAALAAEERARARMGDDYARGGHDKIALT